MVLRHATGVERGAELLVLARALAQALLLPVVVHAAVAHAARQIAVATLIHGACAASPELPTLAVWLLICVPLLLLLRNCADRFVLSHARLRDEIHVDRNWGVALVAGAYEVSLATTLVALIPRPCAGGFVDAADYGTTSALVDHLWQTRTLQTVLAADRLYALLVTLEVLLLAAWSFSLPFGNYCRTTARAPVLAAEQEPRTRAAFWRKT